MEVFLALNGFELEASVDEQERTVLTVASGNLARDEFIAWLERHVRLLRDDA